MNVAKIAEPSSTERDASGTALNGSGSHDDLAFAALAERMAHARRWYPEGTTFTALVEELGEVARAMDREGVDRERDELLDVATVAIRLWLGERAP